MQVCFVGSGDAFGSGNRFQTCFHVKGNEADFLIDCGASSLIALKKLSIDLKSIKTILITHFHADHFGGIPFLILEAQFSKRETPLTIAGPPGLRETLVRVMEAQFPGSSSVKQRFDLILQELPPYEPTHIGNLRVVPFPVNHGNPDGLSYYAYRIYVEGRVVSYTSDTEWTDELIGAGREADILIAEAYFYDKKIKGHLDLVSLIEHLDLIQPKRLILTHMSDSMLERLPDLSCEAAEDGLIVEI